MLPKDKKQGSLTILSFEQFQADYETWLLIKSKENILQPETTYFRV